MQTPIEKLTDTTCRELLPALLAGDPVARERMIVGHVWLAQVLTVRVLRKYRISQTWYNDFFGQAYLLLVKYVDRIATGKKVLKNGNIRGYLSFKIQRDLPEYVVNCDVVGIPARTVRDHHQKGKAVNFERTVHMTNSLVDVCDDKTTRPGADIEYQELKLILGKVVRYEEVEQKIVQMREDGKTDEEIGLVVGLSKARVGQIRADIGVRLKQQLER